MRENWEVEQKYVVRDADSLRLRLSQIGFAHQHDEQHCDVYFRHPCRDFRKTDEAFRLRQHNDKTVVTYKGKRAAGIVKARLEIELALVNDDYAQWSEMLSLLGFSPLPPVRKTRQVFTPGEHVADYMGFTVTIDTVDSLGQFAEIELLADESCYLETAQQRIVQLGEKLDLTETESKSYLSLLLEKRGFE